MIGDMLDRLIAKIMSRHDRWMIRRLASELGCIGEGSEVCAPFDIRGAQDVRIGRNVFVGPRVMIGAGTGGEVTLEDEVMLGPDVKIIAGDHRIDDGPLSMRWSGPGSSAPVTIGRGAWIGAGAIVLKGVTIGAGAVVGAGSVVTEHVPEAAVVAGNPARLLRMRRTVGP